MWLDPTVIVLNAFSETIGGFVGLVSLNGSRGHAEDLQSDIDFGGIPTLEGDLHGNRSSSLSEHPY
jgi:hypothetical protein